MPHGDVAMSQKVTEKLKLSNWHLPKEVVDKYDQLGIKKMFKWQVQCLMTGKVLKGGNLLYSAPTSAGKTLVAEILALKRILQTKRKAIFILPFVSVAREKMYSLRYLYSGLGIKVGGFMGSQTPPGGFQKVDIAVCTIERANSLINRLLESNKLSLVSVIVVDELHMIGDDSRGCLLEPLLTKVNFYRQTLPADDESDYSVQIIGMSATLPNMHVLSNWLKADLYCTDFRPVPLTEYVKIGSSIFDNQMRYVRDIEIPGIYENDNELVVNLCLETVKAGRSVLIFCPSKAWCEKLSINIAKSFCHIIRGMKQELGDLPGLVESSIDKPRILDILNQLELCPAGLSHQLKLSISYVTAYHHAGLTMEEKDIIEAAFRKGIIRVLVATTTLSSGVNLPAHRVIIRSPLFLGKVIDTLTYKQMVGRAGRKGIDTSGESVLICKEREKKQVQELLASDLRPARSQLIGHDGNGTYHLKPSVKRALLEVIASGTAKNVDMLNKYVECTMLAAELQSEHVDVLQLVRQCLKSLTDDEFIQVITSEDDVELLVPTQLGSAVFASSMRPDDSLFILGDLNKARKAFVLENELHMVYQVTPLTVVHDTIDWMRYLEIWEMLPSHQKRVGELVGVSEKFIVLSYQGKRKRNVDNYHRSLLVHKRFYSSLVLHDLINEMPLSAAESKYNINKGTLQSLQQQAAIFAGMICTFCDKLGWKPLKILLSDFQPRLDLGVRSELVDLIRVECLDGKKARHFYDSGLHTVTELVAAGCDRIAQLLQSYLPFESSKQCAGETEWETKERRNRYVYMVGSKAISITQASQLILSDAKCVLQQDLAELGGTMPPLQTADRAFPSHHHDGGETSRSNAEAACKTVHTALKRVESISVVGEDTTVRPVPLEAHNVEHAKMEKRNSIRDGTSATRPDTSSTIRLDTTATTSPNPTTSSRFKTVSTNSFSPITSVKKSFMMTTAVPHSDVANQNDDVLVEDSQETDAKSAYNRLLDKIEDCTNERSHNTSSTSTTMSKVSTAPIQKNISDVCDEDPSEKPLSSAVQSTLFRDTLQHKSFHLDITSINLSEWENLSGSSTNVQSGSSLCDSKQRDVSNVMLTKFKNSPLNSPNILPHSSVPQRGCLKRNEVSPLDCYTKLKRRRADASLSETPKSHHKSIAKNDKSEDRQSLCASTPETSGNKSLWSPLNDTCLLSQNPPSPKDRSAMRDKSNLESPAAAESTSHSCHHSDHSMARSSGSVDLFSKSLDSITWSPLSESVAESPRLNTSDAIRVSKTSASRNFKLRISDVELLNIEKYFDDFAGINTQQIDKLDIIDVACNELLFDTFIQEWQNCDVYSLSLACKSTELRDQTSSQLSIGYKSENSQDGNVTASLSVRGNDDSFGVDYGIVGIAVSMNINTVFYIDLDEDSQPDSTICKGIIDRIVPVLNGKNVKLIFDSKSHQKKFKLLHKDVNLTHILDPKVAIWLLDPEEKERSLIGAVTKYTPHLIHLSQNVGACPGNGSIGINPHANGDPKRRSCLEAISVQTMMSPLLNTLKQHDLKTVFYSIEMPHLLCLADMESIGFGFNMKQLKAQRDLITKQLNSIETHSMKYLDKRIDFSSPKDIGEMLFVKLKLPYEPKKFSGKRGRKAPWSTAQTQLDKIKHLHPLPGMITLWRKLNLTLKTLIEPLKEVAIWCEKMQCYRIHPDCSIHTSTGRVTMSEPNLQAMTKDFSISLPDMPDADGVVVSLRSMFTACKGSILLSADYSQLELRIISHLASDPILIELLNGGGDVFKDVAARWKSVPVEEVTNEQRQQAKQLCYGVIYGMGVKALSEQLHVDELTAEQLMTQFQLTFTGLKQYSSQVVESCQKLGYVTTLAGRRRYLPSINSHNNRARSQSERQAVNTTVQGSAADIIKLATVNICKKLPPGSNLVLQIHDELIFEVPENIIDSVVGIVRKSMEEVTDVFQLKVRLCVRMKLGKCWATLK